MKNFKKNSIKLIAIAICLSAGIFFSFKPTKQNHSYQDLNERFDGETIFRGVYFGNKTVAQFIPELFEGQVVNSNSKNLTTENGYIKEIKQTDPNFFSTFKAKIESGNPVSVEEALTSGNNLLSKLMVKKQIMNSGTDNGYTDSDGTVRYLVNDLVVAKHTESTFIDIYNSIVGTLQSALAKKGLEREKIITYITQNLEK